MTSGSLASLLTTSYYYYYYYYYCRRLLLLTDYYYYGGTWDSPQPWLISKFVMCTILVWFLSVSASKLVLKAGPNFLKFGLGSEVWTLAMRTCIWLQVDVIFRVQNGFEAPSFLGRHKT